MAEFGVYLSKCNIILEVHWHFEFGFGLVSNSKEFALEFMLSHAVGS
jgi:hypothetical protein